MNGMSLVKSKPCCRMYCTSNKIDLIPRNKIDLIPLRLSNLHLQGITFSVATTHKLKPRPYLLSAALKDDGKGGPRSEVPEATGVVLPPSVFLGVAIIGIALAKPMEVAAQSIPTIGGIRGIFISSARFFPFPLFVATFVAGCFLGHIMYGLAVLLHNNPFSVGEIIQVGAEKGQVTNIGLLTTSLLGAENASLRVLTNSLFGRQAIVNKSRAGWCEVVSKFLVEVDEIEKIHLISEEIINMMKSNSNVYLEEGPLYCCLSGFQRYWVELTLRFNLKKMCEDDLLLAKQNVLLQSAEIIKKHGAKLAQHMEK